MFKTKVVHCLGTIATSVPGAQQGVDIWLAGKHTGVCDYEPNITFGKHVARKPVCKQ